MNKDKFLLCLKERLSGFPVDLIEHTVEYYSEIIDDLVEDGVSEEEAVSSLGAIDDIVTTAINDMPFPKLIKEKVRPSRTLYSWEVVLLILGFPLWFSLILSAGLVLLSIYLAMWSVIIAMWSVVVGLGAAGIGGIISVFVDLAQGRFSQGIFFLGAGLVCVGISILLFYGFKEATKGILIYSRKVLVGIKSLFIKKED